MNSRIAKIALSSCRYKTKLDQSLRLLLNGNLALFSANFKNCGPRVLAYLLESNNIIGIDDRSYQRDLIQAIDHSDLTSASSDIQHTLYKGLVENQKHLVSKQLQSLEASFDFSQFSQAQLGELKYLYDLQGKSLNVPSWKTQQEEFQAYLGLKECKWKVEHFSKDSQIALLSNGSQLIMVYANVDSPKASDFATMDNLLVRFKNKPMCVFDAQPIPLKGQDPNINPNDFQLAKMLQVSLKVAEYQKMVRGQELLQFMQMQILDPTLIRIRAGIAYSQPQFPEINALATILLMMVKHFQGASNHVELHLADLPQNVIDLERVQQHDLAHFQNLLQLCNQLTITEKLRYMHSHGSDLPCFSCSEDASGFEYSIPKGYQQIVRGDSALYSTELADQYSLSICKEYLTLGTLSKDGYVFCIRNDNFRPLLKGIVNNEWPEHINMAAIQDNQAKHYKEYISGESELYDLIEKHMLLETIHESDGLNYLGYLASLGLNVSSQQLQMLEKKLQNYRKTVSLDNLITNLASKDRSLFQSLTSEIGSECLANKLIFEQENGGPSTRVNQHEQKKIYKMIKDFCE